MRKYIIGIVIVLVLLLGGIAMVVIKNETKEKKPIKSNGVDYSKKENWFKIPEITKDVDTFYVCATEYILGSLQEGAPEFADLDNEEMRQGFEMEYLGHATTYEGLPPIFLCLITASAE